MTASDAIVNPVKPRNAPAMGPVAVMAATRADLFDLCDLFGFNRDDYRRLFISRLYMEPGGNGISLTGPFIGAPYAAMLLETLIARGARKIVFLGWCGSICETVKIGDIIVPTSAIIDEGTSRHYQDKTTQVALPSDSITAKLETELEQKQANFHQGPIWTTDAVYRETRQKVEYYQHQGAIGVEMEISALFTVANFRRVEVAALVIVGDELTADQWRPGFKTNKFEQGRQQACAVIRDLCQKI